MTEKSSKTVDIDISIPNETKYLGMVGRIGESLAFSLKDYPGSRRELAYHLNLVLTEAIANAISHGNQSDPNKSVRICISVSDENLLIKVYDQGSGFNIDEQSQVESYDSDEGGRGIHLILKLMDQVNYVRENDCNVLIISKKLA